jgi:hypothetical protein
VVAIKSDCNDSANKSNRPIQNPLLFVTEPVIRDNIKMYLREIGCEVKNGWNFLKIVIGFDTKEAESSDSIIWVM